MSSVPGLGASEESSHLHATSTHLDVESILNADDEAGLEELHAWTNKRPQRQKTTKAMTDVRKMKISRAVAELKDLATETPITQLDAELGSQILDETEVNKHTAISATPPSEVSNTQVEGGAGRDGQRATETMQNVTPASVSQLGPVKSVDAKLATVLRHSKFTIKSNDDVKAPVYSMLNPSEVANAPKDRNGNHIFSYHLFRGPEKQKVNLHYVWQLRGAEARAKLFLKCKIVGFDTEFSVGCNGRIQLIQIASDTDVALFHVGLLEREDHTKAIPKSLRKILESPNIIKTGSHVLMDAAKVKSAYGIKVRACVDLKRFLHAVHPQERGEKAGLSALTKRFFGLELDKDPGNRSGDWSKLLDPKQIEYGGSDAYAGLKVYQKIDAERQAKRLPSALHLINAHITPFTIAAERKRKTEANLTLYERLHQLRLELGAEAGVDGCRIITNATMTIIANTLPMSVDELLAIPSTKHSHFHEYAKQIIKVVEAYVEEHDIDVERHKRRRLMRSESISSTQDSGYGSCSQTSFFDEAMYNVTDSEDLHDLSITGADDLEDYDASETAMASIDLTVFDNEDSLEAGIQVINQAPVIERETAATPSASVPTSQEMPTPAPMYHQTSLVPEENASANWYRATRIGGTPLSSVEPHARKNKTTKPFDMESYKKFLKNVKKEKETNKNSSFNKDTAFMRHLNEHPW